MKGQRLYSWLLAILLQQTAFAFVVVTPSSSKTQLNMVFDFFKDRTKEGIDQLNNLAKSASQGQLGKGLADVASYTNERNKAFAEGLSKSRNRFLDRLEFLFTGIDPEEMMQELEDILLQADLGIATAEDIVQEVQSLRESSRQRLSREDLMSIMRGKILEALETEQSRMIQFSQDPNLPTVLFILGANGMGKTTTIGKLAHRLRIEGNQTVLVAACDTFRAGAVAQLQQWADRAQVDIVGPTDTVKSPAAVLYSALDKAVLEKYDTLLVDTSGRLSNNEALTQELVKMKRVIQKRLSQETNEDGNLVPNMNVPHETLLVIDAAQGRMALDSAQVWNKEIGLTGLILTKLDGSARGGSVVAVSRDLQLPVKLIGVGEGMEDLRDFEPDGFVDGLLGIGAAGGSSKVNEGAMLQARLDSLRAERDQRAQEKQTVLAAPVAPRPVVPPLQVNAANRAPNSRRGTKSKRKKSKK
ncbi:fused signal recognition particle receptor [Fistulifera solaris]|uniref:Fused signal recognition particle receptor n=1 Tax=Fistulifera solaris TaxID=1519565 RepID=A0A1Z5JNB2_FISSO|nr:fused signal recognition particle receptor [Fistulifera solaris]|eukprot:GAX15342.1 fused signal recognition particle receptor [Fistulifera solaris]